MANSRKLPKKTPSPLACINYLGFCSWVYLLPPALSDPSTPLLGEPIHAEADYNFVTREDPPSQAGLKMLFLL